MVSVPAMIAKLAAQGAFFLRIARYFRPDLPRVLLLLGVIGPWQIVLIVVVLLLLFGGKKIPELMRGLGQGMKEFKDASKEEQKSTGTGAEDRK